MSQSYAGLWIRVKAFSADYLVISLYIAFLVAISILIQSVNHRILQPLFGNPLSGQLSGFVLITLPVTLYFTISESSSHQATWGKRWQAIKVVHNNGERLSRIRALGRTALKFIPWELAHTCIWQMSDSNQEPSPIILIGFILVWILVGIYLLTLLLSSKKQTLYDQFTNVLVVRN
ncbi:hypothetical protein Asal01_00321 [Fodinibius salicampi]|uniref:RDD family protein n=1 Tax=Fodinibius salicampi TaxID=1920655 RepID=UPI002245F66B|nr:RDD family protein [Fodinibius salicampi]